MSPDDLLDTRQAAVYLGGSKPFHEGTLRIWRAEKRGPRYLKIGFSVRYRRSDLDAYMKLRQGTNEATDEQSAAHTQH